MITASTIFLTNTDPGKNLYWIHDKFICSGKRLYAEEHTRQLKLCTKLHNTETDICDLVAIFGTLTCYVYSDLSLYTQVDVVFLILESNQDRPCGFVMSC